MQARHYLAFGAIIYLFGTVSGAIPLPPISAMVFFGSAILVIISAITLLVLWLLNKKPRHIDFQATDREFLDGYESARLAYAGPDSLPKLRAIWEQMDAQQSHTNSY